MKITRNNDYAVYKKNTFELASISNDICKLISREDFNNKYKNLGFTQITNKVCALNLYKREIDSAYSVSTFCRYREFKFQVIEIILDSGKIKISPSMEAQIYFKDLARHGYDPYYEVEEYEIGEIWEERKPIDEFEFDVEPIYYIKRNDTVS